MRAVIRQQGPANLSGSTCLGIDPSLTNFAIVSSSSRLVIKSKAKGPERLIEIREALREVVEAHNGIEVVAVEGYSFGSPGRAHAAGELGGVIRVLLYELLGPGRVYLVPPSTLKKFVTGKGNSKKNEILKAVFQKWGEDFSDDNLADAYGLLRFAQAIHAGQGEHKYETECLEKADRLA